MSDIKQRISCLKRDKLPITQHPAPQKSDIRHQTSDIPPYLSKPNHYCLHQQPKRILIIGQTPPPFGGQAINIQKILVALQNQNIDHRFIRLHFSEQLNDMGRFNGTKLWRLFTTFCRIIWYLISYRPHLIYYPPAGPTKNAIYRDIILLFPIRLLNYKLVFHFHAGGLSNMSTSLPVLIQPIFRFAYYHAAHAICFSERGKIDPIALKAKNIHIIPSGVEDLKTDTPLQQKQGFTVLFAGLCSESKGILDFITVIRKCNEINPLIKGRIIGKIFSDKEETIIINACGEGIVRYDGLQTGNSKKEIFASSSVFLFPTHFESESFPTVILEAFSASLPVVSTNWRGIPDQVTHEVNGFLWNVNDTDSMASSILRLAVDTNLYQQLSSNARHNFETKYMMSTFENSIVSFFKTNA